MKFGAHLPIAGFTGVRPTASTLIEYAEAAEALGYDTLAANDHLMFSIPWVDGLVALGAAAARTNSIRLMTTASLLVVRGPAPLGSAVAALADLSGDRLTVCLTPGSTAADYEAVGIPFEERWARFDDDVTPFRSYLDMAGVTVPIWIASWGSEAGLRRVARHGDGWLASAYHASAATFEARLAYLSTELGRLGRDALTFPHAIATTYMHLTDDPSEAQTTLRTLVSPRQAPADLREHSLIGPSSQCIEKLRRLQAAGAQEVLVWPVADEVNQLRRFATEVIPQFER